ncbi:hypothetical protein [Paenibacillus alvei]|nr:hypothetical protein [Paenibacillus alvei]
MGKKIAEVGVQTGEEIWSGVKKTGNSIAEIGIDFWNGLEVRANKSLDSPYDFGNWLTVGAFDEVSSRIEGYKTRDDMRNESPYDYVNWLSSGIAGSFKEAFNPDDPLSKEHWMSSFDVVTLILGARGAAPKGSGPTLPKVNAKTPVPIGGGSTVNWGIKERLEAFQQSASQLSKNKLVYDGPNANYKSSTQKPLEPTKNQIEVRKYYPGSDLKNSASGSTSGKNKNSSGAGTGEVPPKKNSLPDWLKDRWEAGNNFNKENRPRYPYNEVELEAKEAGGKKFVVDSYVPNKEIVSRKFTQLSEVKESTAISYVRELAQKYSSGSKISNGPFNPNALKGGRLKGELILEIPVQNKPIPQSVLDEATKNKITIRDINGKEYN